MESEKQILEKRAGIIGQVKDKWADVRKENRPPNEDELSFFNKADVDIVALTTQVEELRKVNQNNTDLEQRLGNYESLLTDPVTTAAVQRSVQTTTKKYELRSTIDRFMRFGIGELNAEERSILGKYEKFSPEQRGTLTLISSTTTLGGFTMPEEWASELYKTMLWYGGMLEASGIKYKSSGGGDMHLPKVADTANVGAIIGQGVPDVVLDTTFSELILQAWSYTSKMIKVSWELIEDSAYDIQAEVAELAGIRVGRILNTHFTTGTGISQPLGVVPASTLGKLATSATAITRGEIVDLIHSVDMAHRNGPKVYLMFNNATLAALKKLAFGTGDDRPLWQVSMREGEPDRIEGYKYIINNDMPSIATGQKSIIFGDFNKYIIRQVGGYQLARSADRYIDERAVVFFVFARFDGDLLDTAAIKHLIQA